MSDTAQKLPAKVTISVERMIRYCYLVEMLRECKHNKSTVLPLHVTRSGTLTIEIASFLYSLFDDHKGSIHLCKIWQGFDHPFKSELQEMVDRLNPIKKELSLVRNRIGFHGSLDRTMEKEGLGMFDVDSGRAAKYVAILLDMQALAIKMIRWYCCETEKADGTRDIRTWQEFCIELKGNKTTNRGKS